MMLYIKVFFLKLKIIMIKLFKIIKGINLALLKKKIVSKSYTLYNKLITIRWYKKLLLWQYMSYSFFIILVLSFDWYCDLHEVEVPSDDHFYLSKTKERVLVWAVITFILVPLVVYLILHLKRAEEAYGFLKAFFTEYWFWLFYVSFFFLSVVVIFFFFDFFLDFFLGWLNSRSSVEELINEKNLEDEDVEEEVEEEEEVAEASQNVENSYKVNLIMTAVVLIAVSFVLFL